MEKLRCPACGWEGESETCPNCDFPLANFRHLLSGDLVLYDESLKAEFEALVQKHRTIYQGRRPTELTEAQSRAPDEETQRHWFATLLRLAEELNDKVETAVTTIQKKDEEIKKELELERMAASKLLENLSQRFRSAFSLFQQKDIGGGFELAELEKEVERGISIDVGGTRVEDLVKQVNSLWAQLYTTNERLQKTPEKREGVGWGIGCLSWIVLSVVLSAMLVPWAERGGVGVLTFIILVCGLPTVIAVILGRWLGYRRPAGRRERLQAEVTRLDSQIRESLRQLESRIDSLLGALRDHLEATISTKEGDRRREYDEFVKQIGGGFKRWFQEWKKQANGLRQEMGRWGAGWEHCRELEPTAEPMSFLRLGEWIKTIDIPGVIHEIVSLPALVPFIGAPGLLFIGSGAKREEIIKCIQSLCFRFLISVPPGKLRFTFIDPVGLGDNVASLLHLREFDESEEDSLVTSRAWTETEYITKQLLAIKDHIAIVIQERLRDQYQDIEEYNREAGEVAVPYKVLVVLDFPVNFSSEAAQALLSIAQTGKRVGVFTIVHYDPSRKLPHDFKVEELSQALYLVEAGGGVLGSRREITIGGETARRGSKEKEAQTEDEVDKIIERAKRTYKEGETFKWFQAK
jgi:hypothetical protein